MGDGLTVQAMPTIGERDPEKVRWDVVEGYVSLESARRDYGVVLEPGTLEVDQAATDRLRAVMSADSPASS